MSPPRFERRGRTASPFSAAPSVLTQVSPATVVLAPSVHVLPEHSLLRKSPKLPLEGVCLLYRGGPMGRPYRLKLSRLQYLLHKRGQRFGLKWFLNGGVSSKIIGHL
jgi:hypothetical protein